MSVRVINIKKEYEPLLVFLFPTYSYVDGVHGSSKFITHHDVVSRAERDTLGVYYDDCIFISSRVFDEVWDEDVLKEKCVQFANTTLKNRKKKVVVEKDTFVQDCINFMFNLESDDEEEINELLDTFGSARFVPTFLNKSERIPIPKLVASLNTFIGKILIADDSSSVYYKSKAVLYKKKIRQNMVSAIDNLTLRGTDTYGLSMCKFYIDLFS